MSLGSRRCRLRRAVAVLIMGMFAFECGEPLLAAGAAPGTLVEPVVAAAGAFVGAAAASAPSAAGTEVLTAAPTGVPGQGERTAPSFQPCACTQAATSLDATPSVPVPSLLERAAPPQPSVRVPAGPTPEIPLRPPAARAV